MSDATPIRDPKPEQYKGVSSVGRKELLHHVTMLGRVATAPEIDRGGRPGRA
jgi:hypothetical protein